VQVVPAQHTWVALPGPLVSKLLDSAAQLPLVLRLTPAAAASAPASSGSSSAARYVAWAGAAASAAGAIEVPAALAGALGLRPGMEVALQPLPGIAAAAAVVVEPCGAADWEVVDCNAGLLEAAVLGQVRRVHAHAALHAAPTLHCGARFAHVHMTPACLRVCAATAVGCAHRLAWWRCASPSLCGRGRQRRCCG
jgi:hypothetical protein